MTKYPLTWPAGWKRTTSRCPARFSRKNWSSGWRERITISEATTRVLGELRRMGAIMDSVLISSNLVLRNDGLPRSDQREPADPGIAVYWKKRPNEQYKVMAIDQYTKVADNLAAVAATLDAMRAIERHGGAIILERAFTGFTALPAPNTWRSVFGYAEGAVVSAERLKADYRELSKKRHPDRGGSEAQMKELNWAMQQAEAELHGR